MEHKFVAAKKPENVNTAVQRRQRLVRRLDQQIGLIKSTADGMLPRTVSLWMDDAGSYFLSVKYGRQPIELMKGMFAIRCETIEQASEALVAIKAMVLKGDFNSQLGKASKEIRKRFSKE